MTDEGTGTSGERVHIFAHRAVGPLACNCYIVGDEATREAIVIDPGGDADELSVVIAEQELKVTAIVATHAHFDHLLAAERLREMTGAPFYLHRDDKPVLEWFQDSGRMFLGIELGAPPVVDTEAVEGNLVTAGSAQLEIIHTPGHSPGSIALIASKAERSAPDSVFAGDTLFAGSVGRTDLPGGDTQALVDSVRSKLFALDLDLPVYPGHGPITSLGAEMETNPFVGRRAEGLWTPGDQ